MRLERIAVTGGSGGVGRHVIADLLAHGYDVINIDLADNRDCETKSIDLRDFSSLASALDGMDAVVHVAANPVPDIDASTGAERFEGNTVTTYNVMWAAARLGIERVVWASSETVFGFPFDNVAPHYLPVDDLHPLMPQNSYAISKVACEEAARRLHEISGTSFIGLRLSNVLHTAAEHPASYSLVPGYHGDPTSRKFNLWGYIDARDAASAARLGLQAGISGAHEVTIAAEDTIMDLTNKQLVEAVFPGVPLAPGTGEHESLLSIEKARRLLGYEPLYSWRDQVSSG